VTRRQVKTARRTRTGIGTVVGLAALGITSSAQAATYVVDTLADTPTAGTCDTGTPGDCNLREAVAAANATTAVDDTITFQAGLSGSILLGGQITISDALQIDGPGAAVVSVDGQDSTRIFLATAPGETVGVSGLTLAGGSVNTRGAAVASIGTDTGLAISASTFTGNAVSGSGGAVYGDSGVTIENSVFSDNGASVGGAVYGGGAVTVSNSTFSHNHGFSGGAIAGNGPLAISDSTFDQNDADEGGAVRHGHSTVSISGSTFSGNTATSKGGAAFFNYGVNEISNSTISGNTAGNEGGGIFSYSYYPGDQLTIGSSTITGNTATDTYGYGGGINARQGTGDYYGCCAGVPVIQNSIVMGNSAFGGADLFIDDAGYLGPAQTSFSAFGVVEPDGAITDTVPGSDLFGIDPQLGPLQDNGGPTATRRPAAGSPVLDRGNSHGLTLDQRGSVRPFDLTEIAAATGGDDADIGAVELTAAEESPTPPPPPPQIPVGGCDGKAATVVGTPGPDRLKGTPGPDVIRGLAGDDVIAGVEGDDLICGGSGRDTLRGGPGKDRLIGGAGSDKLSGGPGHDQMFGGTPGAPQALLPTTKDRCHGENDKKHGC
jgi:CSLREA domain-containing protein